MADNNIRAGLHAGAASHARDRVMRGEGNNVFVCYQGSSFILSRCPTEPCVHTQLDVVIQASAARTGASCGMRASLYRTSAAKSG